MKRLIFLFLLLALPVTANDQRALTFDLRGTTTTWLATSTPAPIQGKNNAKTPSPPPAVVHNSVAIVQIGPPPAGMPAPATAPVPAPSGSATLRWKNGETLHGDITTASASDLTWKSSLFEDPLQLRWNVIDRIEWPTAPFHPSGPFSIALRDGSFIYGDVVLVDADSISIHSARHGDAVLKRSEVLNARRLSHGSLQFCGPTGDIGWQPMTGQQDGSMVRNAFAPDFTPPLATGPCGALQIRNWNRSASLEITLPDRVDLEFRVQSSKRPEFMLSLGGAPHDTLRVETWDDVLVLAEGDDFKAIGKIQENQREVALRICWDVKAQKCSVFSPAGELITEWQVPGNISSMPPGLILQNKGLDLSLDSLRVRTWDGKPPAKLDPKQPHLELADGRCISGEISAGAPGSVNLQAPGQALAKFPITDVDAFVFPPTRRKRPAMRQLFYTTMARFFLEALTRSPTGAPPSPLPSRKERCLRSWIFYAN